jgi:hypothetical protein
VRIGRGGGNVADCPEAAILPKDPAARGRRRNLLIGAAAAGLVLLVGSPLALLVLVLARQEADHPVPIPVIDQLAGSPESRRLQPHPWWTGASLNRIDALLDAIESRGAGTLFFDKAGRMVPSDRGPPDPVRTRRANAEAGLIPNEFKQLEGEVRFVELAGESLTREQAAAVLEAALNADAAVVRFGTRDGP